MAVSRLAREHGVGIHTHLAESKVQVIGAGAATASTIVGRLEAARCLGPGFVGAHGVWLTDDDLGCSPSRRRHRPQPGEQSPAGCGIAPVREMLDLGVAVGLGTDGSVCADNQNLFEALRIASVVSTIRFRTRRARWLDARTVWDLATAGSARVLGLAGDVGAIAPDGRRISCCCARTRSSSARSPIP